MVRYSSDQGEYDDEKSQKIQEKNQGRPGPSDDDDYDRDDDDAGNGMREGKSEGKNAFIICKAFYFEPPAICRIEKLFHRK